MMMKAVDDRQRQGHDSSDSLRLRTEVRRVHFAVVKLTDVNLNPHWRVIAGFIPSARFAVDPGDLQASGERGT